MHVGLIGGIGPAATVHYYRALVKLFDHAGQKMSLTIVHADSREMVRNMTAEGREAQAEIFARHTAQLMAGGCEAVALTSMGGHFCIGQFEPLSPLPVINAIPVLNRTFAEKGLKRVGILGTRAVMESALYGVSSTRVMAPPPEEIRRTHETYLAIADAGVATEEQRAYLEQIAARLQQDQGAEAIVLGGTDLFVAFDRQRYEYEIIDCAIVHAQAIASFAMGHSGEMR